MVNFLLSYIMLFKVTLSSIPVFLVQCYSDTFGSCFLHIIFMLLLLLIVYVMDVFCFVKAIKYK